MVNREHGKVFKPEAVAAPATVSGEHFSANATDGPIFGTVGKVGERRLSRKPGDLPARVAHLPYGACGRAESRSGD